MLTLERLRELLSYETDTGIFVWLKSSPRGGRRIAGKVAGSLAMDGYIEISIDARRYKAHRLAWLYVHGTWPADVIDHINGTRNDNRLSNLREASHSQNLANSKLSKLNKFGLKGVHLHRKTGKYCAMIRARGAQRYLGLFETPEAAHAAYMAAAISANGDFANDGNRLTF